jgi:hypothetical protein
MPGGSEDRQGAGLEEACHVTMRVRGLMVSPNGSDPAACPRRALRQPLVTAALQRLPFRMVTEALTKSVT